MSKEEEADHLRSQLSELKQQLDDYHVALEAYEVDNSVLSEKQKIVYEMFKAFIGNEK